MTITADENLSDDQWYGADPPDPGGVPAGDGPTPDAPYGWTRDSKTGERRPKRSQGRPRKPRGESELRAGPPPEPPKPDKPPADHKPIIDPADVPMPKGGVIAKGVNRLYRRAGKFCRILDDDIGLAIIECTRPDPDDPEAPTVGQAWEALAADNPRIRAWLLKLIAGGAWQDLIMAHAAIGVALATKTWVRRLIPWNRVGVLFEPDEDSEPGDLEPDDVEAMRATAEAQAHKIASRLGVPVPPGVAAEAMRQAQAAAANGEQGIPPGLRRHQPQRATRAKRRGR